ncbi:hypothetical protein EPUL_005442, partial [Erysiphe pulchra]
MGAFFSGPSSAAPAVSGLATLPISNICGDVGSFILNFDDIPPLAIGNEPYDSVQPMPLFNPYHQFDFSNGFAVVPPPTSPYLPSSKPLLLEYIPNVVSSNNENRQLNITQNTLGQGISAGIGNGDHGRTGCFSFNVMGASFGCDST